MLSERNIGRMNKRQTVHERWQCVKEKARIKPSGPFRFLAKHIAPKEKARIAPGLFDRSKGIMFPAAGHEERALSDQTTAPVRLRLLGKFTPALARMQPRMWRSDGDALLAGFDSSGALNLKFDTSKDAHAISGALW